MNGVVEGVQLSATHSMRKTSVERITLIAGLGVAGDAHMGETVQHRSRVAVDPTQPNLRQVHLVHAELHDDLAAQRIAVTPGAMGENVTTRGVDLLGLPAGTRLRLGTTAVVEITGLRTPCAQLDGVSDGLMAAVLDRDAEGRLVRKAGVMAVVIVGGPVRSGDRVAVELPPAPWTALQPV